MTEHDWQQIEHFTRREFDSKGKGEVGTGDNMQLRFVQILDGMRDELGFPLKIVSGFRTKAHNKTTGGKPNSAHLRGWAVDIACKTDEQRGRIIEAAQQRGIVRIGIAKTFIHLDMDPSLPTPRVWLYA